MDEISDEEYEAATRRGSALRETYSAVTRVQYDEKIRRVVIALASGLELAFSPEQFEGLENATPEELNDMEITPSGLGIHFSQLDVDVYLPALIAGSFGTPKWMALRGKPLAPEEPH